ncbi:hypothetical protein DVK85_02130 [Flavobacterium arcticum]|uniref:Uncharacterized protein n=2 Tax=Flavobacterium arcticum TaxID=1784713 RepID=A0A345H928_9FLAO|nr:hypothetical protein [Flavobacterium arcticum]AXG73088.1 hypothetical protein DVK85_02130 [Flavobacterium arcticum]KAF2512879.1 hypothetical protein E0W72_00200 [Flavobacterium arcticum]
MSDTLPNWTEVAQFIIGSIGMGVALWTLIKLVSRDKQRESEIASLSLIASKLEELQEVNQKRYVESKNPQLEIRCDRDYELGGHYFLYFKNLNNNGKITKFLKSDYKGGMVSRISNLGKEQEFAFSITAPKKGETLTIFMTYIIEDTHEFQQELFIYYYQDKLIVRPLTIELMIKNNNM